MAPKIPNFFEGRTEPWRFEDVLTFIRDHFEVKEKFAFRIGTRSNNPNEHQAAGQILAYSQLMDYTFNQVKALFSEHDHFAIAMPETKQGTNILVLNELFADLLQKGYAFNAKINDFPELFDIPKDVLIIKNRK
ncbi:MAG TPA: HopJ type III effector protein [Patescibacteria group bacterium]|nr:HopJ type III effector protein [Patescibacteria group bacterium]